MVVLLLLLGVGTAVYLLVNHGNQSAAQLSVPSVVDQKVAAATAELQQAGFHVNPRNAVSTQDQKGKVIQQDPTGGSKAARGATVVITVGTGPESVSVPNLQGLTESKARDALEAEGLELGDTLSVSDSSVPAGQVVKSDPAGGEKVDKGARVDIYLADDKVAVPNLLGLTAAQARTKLSGTGLVLKVRPEVAEEEPGKIFAQSPSKGSKLEPGDTVTVRVAEEPDETPTSSPTVSPSASVSASPPSPSA